MDDVSQLEAMFHIRLTVLLPADYDCATVYAYMAWTLATDSHLSSYTDTGWRIWSVKNPDEVHTGSLHSPDFNEVWDMDK